MNPELIVFAVRASIRLAKTADKAFTQHARDKKVLLPDVKAARTSANREVIAVFKEKEHGDFDHLILGDGPLAPYWKNGRVNQEVDGAFEILRAEAKQIVIAKAPASGGQGLSDRTKQLAGAMMIEQWAEHEGPVGPVGRMVLTIADVALEYVGANPSVLGIGGNGEKLIGAFAGNLETLIPNDAEDFGPRSQFSERLVQIVMHAGLKTFQENPKLVVRKEHLQSLIANTLPPLVEALPEDLSKQSKWRDVADALLGPAASAAIETIAVNQKAFFGSDFAIDKPLGALTEALLKQAAETGLEEQFSPEGYIALFRAAAGVVATRPELFLGDAGTDNSQKIANALLSSVAKELQAAPFPFNGELGLNIAVAALDTVKANTSIFFDDDDAWEQVSSKLVQQVIGGLSQWIDERAWKDGKIPLSGDQVIELGRIFLTQAGQTPGMVTGDRSELKAIVAGVAKAMASDKKLLISGDDWLKIAAVAASEAAANPGRLFGLDENDVEEAVASGLISTLLGAAAESFGTAGRDGKGVLFGATLRDSIVLSLHATAGNVAKLKSDEGKAAIEKLAKAISDIVEASPDKYGSKEWLRLYRSQIGKVLATGKFEALTETDVVHILEGREG